MIKFCEQRNFGFPPRINEEDSIRLGRNKIKVVAVVINRDDLRTEATKFVSNANRVSCAGRNISKAIIAKRIGAGVKNRSVGVGQSDYHI